jgi:hypothetical protein
MKARWLALILGICTTVVVQMPAWGQSGQYYSFIGKVLVGSDGYLWINVPENLNPGGCPNPWYAVSQSPLSDDRTRAQLQIALASFLSQKKVYIVTNGCTQGGQLILESIQIEQP